jgi:hypothetical protein
VNLGSSGRPRHPFQRSMANLSAPALPPSNTLGALFVLTIQMTRRDNPARILRAFAFSTEGETAPSRELPRRAGRAQGRQSKAIKWDGNHVFLPETAAAGRANLSALRLCRTPVR